MLWRQELSVFPHGSLDPTEILRALSPRGPHQPGLWGESSSPVLPQPPPQQAGKGCSVLRGFASSRDTYVNNVIFNRGDKGRKHHRKLADSKERKEEEVPLY